MNILDYLSWRNDIPFSISPFNDIDSLILSMFSYIDLDDIVPDNGTFITVKEVENLFFQTHDYDYIKENEQFTRRSPLILRDMANGVRFKNIKVGYFINEVDVDIEKQFSAVTFKFEDGTHYISFRGTDNSIVAWKEDFKISCLRETAGMKDSVKYLNRISDKISGNFYVGGHSKGGNFAVYSSAFCNNDIKNRILAIYNNDGPGFREEIVETNEYKSIKDKVISIIPSSSIIGLLLANDFSHKVIESSAAGILQHDPFTWQVTKDSFIDSDLSDMSIFIEHTTGAWLEKLDDDTRKSIIDSVFSLIESSGHTNFNDFWKKKLPAFSNIISGLSKLSKDKQQELITALNDLIKIGGGVAINRLKRNK